MFTIKNYHSSFVDKYWTRLDIGYPNFIHITPMALKQISGTSTPNIFCVPVMSICAPFSVFIYNSVYQSLVKEKSKEYVRIFLLEIDHVLQESGQGQEGEEFNVKYMSDGTYYLSDQCSFPLIQ